MGRPARSEQFKATEVGIVHTIQRCVRRAFLAGVDASTGKDYSFRREWIRRRLEALASVFGIDVLTYSIMSNHLHLILRNRPDVVATWTDRDAAIRWLRVFPGRRLEEHLAEPTDSSIDMLVNQPERLAAIRLRLSDISWFMRALSEPIARMANRQDECTGRFWEGRFKAQRIIDEAGLLACAMYVDLNPLRAALVATPEEAEHTSLYDRLQGEQGKMILSAAFDLVPVDNETAGEQLRQTPLEQLQQQRREQRHCPTGRQIRCDAWLAPLTLDHQLGALEPCSHTGGLRASDKGFLPLSWEDYRRLVLWTAQQGSGRAASELPEELASQLTLLGLDAAQWRNLVWDFKRYFGRSSCAGSPKAMADNAQCCGRSWHHGQRLAAACFIAA